MVCATPSILVLTSRVVEGSRAERGRRRGEVIALFLDVWRGREMRLARARGGSEKGQRRRGGAQTSAARRRKGRFFVG